jgi:ComF family protein
LKDILTGIANVLFPCRCPLCNTTIHDRPAQNICASCAARINPIRSPLCPACGVPFPAANAGDHLCGDCLLSPRAFTKARAVGRYEDVLLTAIHDFKYREKAALGKILGKMMADHDYPDFHIPSYTVIMPVPLHVSRLRERAFNQALILARAVAKKYDIPLDFTSLKRNLATRPQIALGKTERQSNVRGAFAVPEPEKVKGKKIIVIDDVYTTGSTLNECARILVKGGAAEVAALTLARAI